ncbi:hypothetical protein HELRODRAFT_160240 [Helobdella robusta]|uniref:Uncharacterized protein n=1 Tax=Helobdella robusta TaxID=6412 RepID=T1EQ05_HELRO|nr:hypothetical protein HELRODRAFT_160240 [Helobdella robusta]ESO06104.1 hypothetical protein HELRODRAFT_160240 [Helobdella robusta]
MQEMISSTFVTVLEILSCALIYEHDAADLKFDLKNKIYNYVENDEISNETRITLSNQNNSVNVNHHVSDKNDQKNSNCSGDSNCNSDGFTASPTKASADTYYYPKIPPHLDDWPLYSDETSSPSYEEPSQIKSTTFKSVLISRTAINVPLQSSNSHIETAKLFAPATGNNLKYHKNRKTEIEKLQETEMKKEKAAKRILEDDLSDEARRVRTYFTGNSSYVQFNTFRNIAVQNYNLVSKLTFKFAFKTRKASSFLMRVLFCDSKEMSTQKNNRGDYGEPTENYKPKVARYKNHNPLSSLKVLLVLLKEGRLNIYVMPKNSQNKILSPEPNTNMQSYERHEKNSDNAQFSTFSQIYYQSELLSKWNKQHRNNTKIYNRNELPEYVKSNIIVNNNGKKINEKYNKRPGNLGSYIVNNGNEGYLLIKHFGRMMYGAQFEASNACVSAAGQKLFTLIRAVVA